MIFPESKLPLDSQPWGREITKQLSSAINKIDSERVNNTARDNQLNSSIIANQAATIKAQAAADAAGLAAAKAQEAIDSVTSVEEAVYYPGTTEIDGGNIRANTIAANKISAGELVGFTIKTANTGQRAELAGSNISFFNSTSPTSVGSISGNTYNGTYNVIDISGMTTVGGQLWALNGLNVSGGASISGTTEVTGQLNIFGGGFDAALDSRCDGRITAGSFFTSEGLAGGGTTGASINNAGSIIRTTSSARYKQDIEDSVFNYEDILALEPKTFRLKEEVAENSNARRYAGFIAEDIAGTPLDVFVAYRTNEDGEQEPDGVYYAELTSALLSALKHQDGVIKSLETRLEALESKV
jgi:hypothetical protein